MKQYFKSRSILSFQHTSILFVVVVFLVFGCDEHNADLHESDIFDTANFVKNTQVTEEIAVEPPPFSEGIFPCNDCHAHQEPNPKRRELVDWHDEIIFTHDNENRWCLDCHDLNSRDSLKLASGKLLDFKESYKLCGQCHGDKLRDWKVGVHGKRTGSWNGKKEYLLCVHCHNPHSPKFKKLTPEPPPVRQEEIK